MDARSRSTRLRKPFSRTAQALVMGGLCLSLNDGRARQEAGPPRTPEGAVLEEQVRWLREPWYRQPGPRSGGAPRQGGWLYPKRPQVERADLQAVVPSFKPPSFGLSSVRRRSSPFFVDIDADGDQDAFIGEVYGSTYFFENTGRAQAPAFQAPQQNPFGLTDVGRDSSPAFVDIDQDGDQDAFIGNERGYTHFFENTGTAQAPAFQAPQQNPFGLSRVGSYSSPAFVDIDQDGDQDAFIGNNDGNTHFFENTGTAEAPAFAVPQVNPFGLRDVSFSSPAFVDIDSDGDQDAFIGQGRTACPSYYFYVYGQTYFFENTGTGEAPAFAVPQVNPFGLRDVLYSSPAFVDIDQDGDQDAFIGELFGNTHYFENTGTAEAPAFQAPQADPFGLIDLGLSSRPAFVDIDQDGDHDAFIGNNQGNTFFFENLAVTPPPDTSPPVCGSITLLRDASGHVTGVRVDPSDPESGLQRIVFNRLRNATASVEGLPDVFEQGDEALFPAPYPTDSVQVTSTKLNPALRSAMVIRVLNGAGLETTCDPVAETLTAEAPEVFSLDQNYPNPFNPSTKIRVSLAEAGPVSLKVYDVAGRLVAVLLEGDRQAGVYELEWTGRDGRGQALPSGLYVYRLVAGSYTKARTMTLLK